MDGTTRSRVAALVSGIMAQGRTPRAIGTEERLVDAGMTSMDMVNLMLAVEAEFDIMIPAPEITPANFTSIATIEQLVERVAHADAA